MAASNQPPANQKGQGGKHALGVPDDYTVPYQIPASAQGAEMAIPGGQGSSKQTRKKWGTAAAGLQGQQGPRYFTGDQINQLPRTAQEMKALQDLMVQTGFLDPKGVIPGSPDAKTISAFEQVLNMANIHGIDWHSELSNQLASTGADGAAAARMNEAPPLTISLSNPDDLKAVANKTARTLLGQNLSDADLARFVQAYNQQETAQQTATWQGNYGHEVATGYPGGMNATSSTTQVAQPDVAAEAQIRKEQGPQVTAYGIGSQVMAQLDSLRNTGQLATGGPGGG